MGLGEGGAYEGKAGAGVLEGHMEERRPEKVFSPIQEDALCQALMTAEILEQSHTSSLPGSMGLWLGKHSSVQANQAPANLAKLISPYMN